MGELVGLRELVARAEWLPISFVVENDHDHHYPLEAGKTWGEWKLLSLCIVSISLEPKV